MRKMGLGVLVMATLPLLAQQQQKKPFDYHAGDQIQQKVQDMSKKSETAPQGFSSEKFADYGDHSLTAAARSKTGAPEMHEHWADVIIATSGEATIVIGGKINNEVARGAAGSGEMGGTDITGGMSQVVKAGDIINIPAGTPHWIKPAAGKKFAYLNVKVKKE